MNADERPSLAGSLRDFHLIDLFQAIEIEGGTGTLYLAHEQDGRRGVLAFIDGVLAGCQEADSEALTLGMVFEQLNLVSRQNIELLYQQQANDPLERLIGQQAVAQGFLQAEQLADALRTQMVWIAREMSLWHDGSYRLVRGYATDPTVHQWTETPGVEIARVTMEIVRYQYEWNDLAQWLPDGVRTRLTFAEPPEHHPLIFPAPVWRAITRVNGHHTPRRMACSMRQPEMEVARMLAPLVRDGLLVTQATPGQFAGAAANSRATVAEPIDFLALIGRVLQDWLKRRTMLDQLVGLATYLNWTMDEVANNVADKNNKVFATSLENLLRREQCDVIRGYYLSVKSNHIDLDELRLNLARLAESARSQQQLPAFVQEVYEMLERALVAAFRVINRRMNAMEEVRREYSQQNEATWTSLFYELRDTLRYT